MNKPKLYIPAQGDITLIDFEPSAGSEITKRRPALVLSIQKFNELTNLAIVAPITNTVRGMALEIVLPDDLKTTGAVLIPQLKSFDYASRGAQFVEKAPISIVQKAAQMAGLIVAIEK